MPRGLAAARRRGPTLDAAVNRPSDQSGPGSTIWPRRLSSSTVAFGTRFSTTSTPGRAVRGLIDDVEMHGVAAHLAKAADGRLARAHGADGFAMALGTAQFYDGAETFDRAGREIERGLVLCDQLAAFVVVGIRQQGRDRDIRELWIAIKFFAVGKRKFGAFDLQMDEIRAGGIEPVELKSLEQRKLLQHHRTLAPDAGLANRVAAVVVGQRRFHARLPARHVVGREHAAMRRAADVHHA